MTVDHSKWNFFCGAEVMGEKAYYKRDICPYFPLDKIIIYPINVNIFGAS